MACGLRFLFCLLIYAALESRFTSATTSLQVLTPMALKTVLGNEGSISAVPALFGNPVYGVTLVGQLLQANPSDGCHAITLPAASSGLSSFAIVDRGGCSFVTKVRNAQQAGAIATIVVDNIQEASMPFMIDDGTGRDVQIESVGISLRVGQLIKNFIANNPSETVMLSLMYSLVSPDNRVEWDLFTSSWEPSSLGLKSALTPVIQQLDSAQFFTPHYYVFDGVTMGCTQPRLPCRNLCTNFGRYCAVDPDGNLNTGLSGSDVILEDLRQICVWNWLNTTYGEGHNQYLFFKYVNKFYANCTAASDGSSWRSAICANVQMESLNISSAAVTACMNAAGGLQRNGTNTLLQKMITDMATFGVTFAPTIFVNLQRYAGSINCADPIKNDGTCGLVNMICRGFQTPPPACLSNPQCAFGINVDCTGTCGSNVVDSCGKCLHPTDSQFNRTCGGCFLPHVFDICGVCNGDGTSCATTRPPPTTVPNNSTTTDDVVPTPGDSSNSTVIIVVVVSLLVGFAVFGALVFFYLRRQNSELRNELDSVMKRYLPLDDAENLQSASGMQRNEKANGHVRAEGNAPLVLSLNGTDSENANL